MKISVILLFASAPLFLGSCGKSSSMGLTQVERREISATNGHKHVYLPNQRPPAKYRELIKKDATYRVVAASLVSDFLREEQKMPRELSQLDSGGFSSISGFKLVGLVGERYVARVSGKSHNQLPMTRFVRFDFRSTGDMRNDRGMAIDTYTVSFSKHW